MRVATIMLLGLLGCVKQPERSADAVAQPIAGDRSTSGEAESSPAFPPPTTSAAATASVLAIGTDCPLGAITASLSHERTRSGAALVFLTDDDQLSALREHVTAMSRAYPSDVARPVTTDLDRIHDGIRLVVLPRQDDHDDVLAEVRDRAAGLFERCPHLRPPSRAIAARSSATAAPPDLPDFDDDIEPDEPEDPEPGPNEPEPDEPEDPEPSPDEPEPEEPEDPQPIPDEPEPEDSPQP